MSERPVPALLLSTLAAVAALAFVPALGAQILDSRQISPTERVLRVHVPKGQTAHGPVSTVAPPEPNLPEEEEDEQLGPPLIDDAIVIPPQQMVETAGDRLNVPMTPGSFSLLRDSTMAPPAGFSSSVNEPNVAGQGDGIFLTHNWYAEVSTNNGASFGTISPFTTFPNTPAAFSQGFCCDQRAAQDSSRNLVFWLMQWIKNGSTATSTNGDRLAVAHGQAGLASNTWTTYDLTPGLFGLTGKWFDFPHLQASANYLYFTTNIFQTSGDAYYGALIVRIPLAQLDAGSALTVDSFLVTGSYGSIMAINGAAAEGTRTGRTTMYFASVFTSTSLKVLTWPEANVAPTVSDVTGLATTTFATYVCTGPDGFDPCTRANARAQTGWITDSELGIMWTSAQSGAARPYPYTRVAILNPATLAVTSQPDIFSLTSAWLYPAVALNERGHLGGTIDNLGGTAFPAIRALLRDDFSPNVVTSGWETFAITTGNAGTTGRWGDYNGTMPHEKYPKTWLGTGHTQVGGTANGNSTTHNFWFGRERDTNPAVTVSPAGTGTGTVTSSPAGISCGASCSASYVLGTTVTLTASPAVGSTFIGWSGACSGTGSCIVPVDDAKAVTATFTAGQTFTLSVSKTGTGNGTVTSSPVGIACGVTCSAPFGSATVVTLTPSPALGSAFTGWSGACTGTGSCMVTMDAAKSVTAGFDLAGPVGLDYYTIAPCRVLDTRTAGGPLVSGVPRTLAVTGLCGVPADAVAVAINITALTPPSNGRITIFPGGAALPATSSINFATGNTLANNGIVALAADLSGLLGAQSFLSGGGQVDFTVDVVGYFK